MANITFDCANVPVAVCASVLHVDAQTVRLLLQNKLVDWGIAYKRGNSKKFSYLIYPKKFYEATGYVYKGGASNEC